MNVLYKQCWLSKQSEVAAQDWVISWIPSQFAHKGKILKLKENNEWTDGWKVEYIGTFTLTEEEIDKYNTIHKTHKIIR